MHKNVTVELVMTVLVCICLLQILEKMPGVPLDMPTVLCLGDKKTGGRLPFSSCSLTVDYVIDQHPDEGDATAANSVIFFTYKGECQICLLQ